MKKISNINLFLWTIGSITSYQQTVALPAPEQKAVALAAHQHTVVKALDVKIQECVQKYAATFSDLNLGNVSSKTVHIENLKQDLLFHIKRSEHSERKNYAKLEAALEKLDVANKPMQAISDFKQILTMLPVSTRTLIGKTITDPFVKGFLGL